MRLFWKHIVRSLARRPLQPLLILLTVICSTAIAVSALQLSVTFTKRSLEVTAKDRAIGDILITMRGDTDLRMLFCEDAERIVGADGEVIGEFRLSGFMGDREARAHVELSAVDMEAADRFYQFRYTAYGVFTEKDLDTSAIISVGMAEAHGLSIGDPVTLHVLNEPLTYTVQAIAEKEGLLKDRDMLVSIGGLRHVLASRVPAIASLGNSFAPYTRLMIRAGEGVDVTELQQRLACDPAFQSMNISSTENEAGYRFLSLIQNVVLWVPCFLLMLLGALVQISCLSFLHAQRGRETALFCACGASRAQLSALTLMESGLYAAMGALIGLPIAAILLRHAGSLYVWLTEPLKPSLLACTIGCLLSVALVLGCTVYHLHARGMRSLSEELQEADEGIPELTKKGDRLLPLLCLLVSAVCLLLVPVKAYYLAVIAMALSAIWLMYLLLPRMMQGLSMLLQRLPHKKNAPHGWTVLGLKNLKGSFALCHVGRLLALFLSLFGTLAFCIEVMETEVGGITHSVSSDYIAVYADEEALRQIGELPFVEGSLEMSYFQSVQLGDGHTAFALSTKGSTDGFFDVKGYPDVMPTGDEIAISKGLSALIGKRVGDELTVSVKGVTHTFTVSQILRTNAHMVVFDTETLGLKRDFLCINTAGDARESEYAALSAVLEQRGAAIVTEEEIFSSMSDTVTSHARLLRCTLWVAAALILFGSANLLLRQYRERQHEREILMMNGMTRADIRRMHAWELILLLLISCAFALVFGTLLCRLIDIGLRSFGMLLYL